MAAFNSRLYFRIWLAVVGAVVVLALLVGWAWRFTADPPLREAVVRNAAGQVVGSGQSRRVFENRPDTEAEADALPPRAGGPEFVVRLNDGQTLLMQLPRASRPPWGRAPTGFFWMLALVAAAVALGTYPIVRRLTKRLEALQSGVEQFGSGDLSARVPVQGQDEIAYLAQRFNQAAERIETLVKSHKSLLANASHELRSPLTRIRMGLELLGDASTAQREEMARNIAELDQLIDEILLASRLDSKEADIGSVEPVDLAGLAAEECARTGAELDAQPVAVAGVPRLLRRALRNLLENARRYSGTRIDVLLRRDGQQARLQVCDRGPGVAPAERERIFEPFYRAAGASERDGGVGLGLALVKAIAERHGGSVHCDAREGGGAVFTLVLPLAGPAR